MGLITYALHGFYGAQTGRSAEAAALAQPWLVGAALLALGTHRRSFVGLVHMLAERSTTSAADLWISLVVVPREIVRTTALLAVPALVAWDLSVAKPWFQQTISEVGAMLVAVLIGAVTVALMIYMAMDWQIRPLLAALAHELPAGWCPPDHITWSVRVRSFAMLACIAMLGSGFGVALVPRHTSRTEIALLGPVAALLALILLAGPATWLFSAAVMSPVRALLAGSARVAAGDLSTEVPLDGADELGSLIASFNRMQRGLRERLALHDAVSRYVDPVIAERVLSATDHQADAYDVTVMFIDLEAFTTYAESADPADVVARLDRFFDIAITSIEKYGGHANKLLGDGVLAVFGAPVALDDHPRAAVETGLDIQRRIAECAPHELRCGVGINTGRVVMGSMGGGGKRDFTLIGDAVNVAARVEALTRTTGDGILLTESTLDRLTRTYATEDRGRVEVKGRRQSVRIFGIARPG
jgi:class 3 adenylate cyclase